MKEITAADFLNRKNKGEQLLLIDVREVWEFEEESIAEKCCPLGELPQFLDELNAYKQQAIVVHCKTGDRSKKAQKFLIKQGFSLVYSLSGGIEAFRQFV